MTYTPEGPNDDDDKDPDGFWNSVDPQHNSEDPNRSGLFRAMFFDGIPPRVRRMTTGGVALLAVGSFFLALHLEDRHPPKVPATLVPNEGSSFARVTIDTDKPADIAGGTKVEAFCYKFHANNDSGAYRFIIDEGLYNGRTAEAGRLQLHADVDPPSGTGMGRPDDPFNGLPLC